MPRTPAQIAEQVVNTSGHLTYEEAAKQGAKIMLQEIREELQDMVNGWEHEGQPLAHHITDEAATFVKKLQDPNLRRIDFTEVNPGMRIRGVTADGTHIEGNVREIREGVAWLGHPPSGQRGFALGPKTPELYEVTLP